MKPLAIEQLESIQGGNFCNKAGGFLAGVSLGTAAFAYMGIITLATGGTVAVVIAVAGAGLALYCAS